MQTALFDRGAPLRAVTVHHLWAWAIVHGHKPCENRCWPTRHRGPLVIHAGRSRSSIEASRAFCARLGLPVPADEQLHFGSLVGIVELIDVVQELSGPWATGPYCWLLRHPRVFAQPIPYQGQQQLFTLSPETAAAIARQLAR